MKLSAFKTALAAHPNHTVRFVLPTGSKLPIHAHVTEVARLEKRFVDCGGTLRSETACRIQTWVADDSDHRLDAGKLSKILWHGDKVMSKEDLEVEVECEAPFIAHFPVVSVASEGTDLLVHLATKHTACLAQDVCCPPPAKRAPFSILGPLPDIRKPQTCQ
jgi:hypothetical protein